VNDVTSCDKMLQVSHLILVFPLVSEPFCHCLPTSDAVRVLLSGMCHSSPSVWLPKISRLFPVVINYALLSVDERLSVAVAPGLGRSTRGIRGVHRYGDMLIVSCNSLARHTSDAWLLCYDKLQV